MPPPNGTSGRTGVAARQSAGGGLAGRVGAGAVDPQGGQVQAVAVAELAEPVEVERAQEPALGVGDGVVAQVDDRRGGGLVVRDPGQQEHQPGGPVDGRVVPLAAAGERDPLLEFPVAERVPAGQQRAARVKAVSPVAERRRAGHLRPPAGGGLRRVVGRGREPGDEGEPTARARVRSLKTGRARGPAARPGGPVAEGPPAPPVPGPPGRRAGGDGRDVDLALGNARPGQHDPVGRPQVEQPAARPVRPQHARRLVAQARDDPLAHVLAHLVPVGRDGRAEAGQHVGGPGAEPGHGGQRGPGDPGHRAPPAGVHPGQHPRDRVVQHDRHAVADQDGQHRARDRG